MQDNCIYQKMYCDTDNNHLFMLTIRVLARISKMPVQNSHFKISARPDIATNLLQFLIPTTFDSLL